MAPKKTSKGKSGFFSVRVKPSGNFGVEFTNVGRHWWLGTYPTTDEATRAYDVAEDEAGPSSVIPIESSDEDWDDSDEEDKGCDDQDKDELWEQFRSSDDEE
ncbi:putative LRR receptor-like serine/threonine-protein kinase [Hordeum vulgare]|nr:putative LRR receptor-like serine/threonine-protein kinase [Hordeum vulgare]